MNFKALLSAALLSVSTAVVAQTAADPVIMKINGVPVTRSEFEYSYNKNNSDGVIDKKSVKEYVDLFVKYKFKVLAALDEQLDTMSSYQKEFATYRDQQIRPAMIDDADVSAKAMELYKETQERIDAIGGLAKPAHILVMARQDATPEQFEAAKGKADSIYNVLRAANFDRALFSRLAMELSDDKGSARNGGELPFIQQGQTLKEFNDMVFSMNIGETSEPVRTNVGFHIITLLDRGSFTEKMPFDSLRANIINYIDQSGVRNQIINAKLDSLAEARGITAEQVLAEKREEMVAEDSDLKYLIQEYHDGLLLYEISSRTVWGKAAEDTKGLQTFFKKNKKHYAWDEPRFKGMAYRTRNAEDVPAVQKVVKGLKGDDKKLLEAWKEPLRNTFNRDSLLRIRVELGIFKKGDNAIVDKNIFKTDATIKENTDYPYTATYGKLLKAPETYLDVQGQVVADYQEYLEKLWVDELRKKYTVEIFDDVVETVNNH